jgi:hypothetical protein
MQRRKEIPFQTLQRSKHSSNERSNYDNKNVVAVLEIKFVNFSCISQYQFEILQPSGLTQHSAGGKYFRRHDEYNQNDFSSAKRK